MRTWIGVGSFRWFIAVFEVSIMFWNWLFLRFISEISNAILPKMFALQMAPINTQAVTMVV